jgi:hypothetical protein
MRELIADFLVQSAMDIKIHGLQKRIESLESETAYQKLKNELNSANLTIHRLHEEIERLRKNNVETVKKWMKVNEDVEAEKAHELAKKDKEIERLQEALRKKIKTGFWENPDFVAFPVKRTKLVFGNERILSVFSSDTDKTGFWEMPNFIGFWFLPGSVLSRIPGEYGLTSDFHKMPIVDKAPKASGTGLS